MKAPNFIRPKFLEIDDSDEKIPSLGHDDPHSKDEDANSSGSGSGALGSDEHLELDYHFNTP